ncbi:hypothetical protein EDEG_00180, partial [Edhazardia aedis USNM 41457]
MAEVLLNAKQFTQRVKRLQAHGPFIILIGKTSDLVEFGLNSALFIYLLNYEFPETCVVITKSDVYFITSSRKKQILEKLNAKFVMKDDVQGIKDLFSKLQKSSDKIGVVDSKNIKGVFCQNLLSQINYKDITTVLLKSMVIKHADEIECVKNAAKACNFVADNSLSLLCKNIGTQTDVTEKIEEFLDNVEGVNENRLDFVYPVSINTGNSKCSKENGDESSYSLYQPTQINLRLGIRYTSFCAEIGRTILVDPSTEISNVFDKISAFRDNLPENIDAILKQRQRKYGDSKKVEDFIFNSNAIVKQLEDNRFSFPFKVNIYSIGIVKKENNEILTNECDGLTFVVEVIAEVSNTRVVMVDTLCLARSTKFLTTYNKETCVYRKNQAKKREIAKNIMILEHQKELMDALIEEMIQYHQENIVKEEKKVKEFNYPYKKENLIPRYRQLYVDKKKFCVLVPFKFFMLPVPIFAIKNCSVTDDSLRINLNLTGQGDLIKSLMYKSSKENVDQIANKITDLKKEYKENVSGAKTQKNESDSETGESGKSRLIPSTGKRLVLPCVFMRTDIKCRRSKASSLEIHTNGFRYKNDQQTVEILFSNIKHMFYQEGTIDSKTMLHFNLINSINVPKKTMNIQFYREAIAIAQDTSRTKNEHLENIQEMEELNKVRENNKEFRSFVDKIEENSNLRVEMSSMVLFHGVPFKGIVPISATLECLINITETPFFILDLEDVEIVCFERVLCTIKTCDMAVIFKNKTFKQIQCIDMAHLHKIKEYLDSVNKCYIETTVNIQWANLIKEIMKNPISFYENGAWLELQPDREESEETEDDDESEESEDISETEDDDDDEDTDESTKDDNELEGTKSSGSDSSEDSDDSEDEDETESESEESDHKSKKLRRR